MSTSAEPISKSLEHPPLSALKPKVEDPASTKPLRVFAFSAGALDTTMQIGTIHALMLTGVRPDLVLGVSAGAVNAVALGEILTASDGKPPGQADAARAGRFLQLLEAYRETPIELFHAIWPDYSEVHAVRPVPPLKTPAQFQEERRDRERSAKARHGLITLLNSLLQMRLRVSAITRLTRLALDYQAAGDVRDRVARTALKVKAAANAWLFLMLRPFTAWAAAISIGHLTWAWILGPCKEIDAETDKTQNVDGGAKALLFRRKAPRLAFHLFLRLLGAVVLLLTPIIMAVAIVFRRFFNSSLDGLDRILAYFGLRRELGDSFALKHAFIRAFDPGYYGKFNMDYAVNTALFDTLHERDQPQGLAAREPGRAKTLDAYRDIKIVPVAANIRTLEMESIPADTPVVDALLAATAMVPLIGAQKVGEDWFIDGANVSNEPVREALRYLRTHMLDECRTRSQIDLFTVTPFPLPRDVQQQPDHLGEDEEPAYTELTRVVFRGLELQKFRDAELEQDLMRLYNATLPSGSGSVFMAGNVPIIRAVPHRIEAERPLNMNSELPTAPPEERRRKVDEAIAVGCYQTLRKLVEVDSGLVPQGWKNSCAQLISHSRATVGTPLAFPGSNPLIGPGISEVCAACRRLHGGGQDVRIPWVPPASSVPAGANSANGASIRAGKQGQHEGHQSCDGEESSAATAPIVSCLFSGGVFRGVFQIGVANALQLLGVRPKVVAGASVGSITGALIAEVLASSEPKGAMRKLGATYLALDRLVLTDRIADFVRKFTLRAGDADVSLNDFDVAFRRIELNTSGRYLRRIRRVAAGVERVTYITPYDLAKLARVFRDGRTGEAFKLLGTYMQKMLNSYGVGLEALGAEPLALLLREMVLRNHQLPNPHLGKATYADDPECADFKIFRDKLDLIAVTTNLRTGCMEVLKAPRHSDPGNGDPRLLEGLLASSAFPGVFRPLWSWEIFRKQGKQAVQYCDGGILDNLPFNAVVDHIRQIEEERERKGLHHPEVPHLIFTASLEPKPDLWEDSTIEPQEASGSWRKLQARAKMMKYNKKIDDFVRAQCEVHQIWQEKGRVGFRPTNIHVIAVKPKWLCGTFGFHPMLGFRRENQAASIAHGCFATFEEFSRYAKDGAGNHEAIAPAFSKPFSSNGEDLPLDLLRDAKLALRDCVQICSQLPRLNGSTPWEGEIAALSKEITKCESIGEDARVLFQRAHDLRFAAGKRLREGYLKAWLGDQSQIVEEFRPNWGATELERLEQQRREGNGRSDAHGYCWHFPNGTIRCPFAGSSTAEGAHRENFHPNLQRIYELCRVQATHERPPA